MVALKDRIVATVPPLRPLLVTPLSLGQLGRFASF